MIRKVVVCQVLTHEEGRVIACLFIRKCVWDFVSRSSCWQDFTGVVCNWTLKARLTAVKPFNVCQSQMWEFLRCCERKGCQIISSAGKQICGSNALDEVNFFLKWGSHSQVQGFKGLQAKTSRLILHPWRCNDHLSFINRCMGAWY